VPLDERDTRKGLALESGAGQVRIELAKKGLNEIPVNIERAVEDSQDIDVAVFFDYVGNPVMAVKKDPNFARAGGLILVTDLRVFS
jgi:hypothetical protein